VRGLYFHGTARVQAAKAMRVRKLLKKNELGKFIPG
jgi:hypothetical protein